MTTFARRLIAVGILALALRCLHTASIGSAPFARLLVGDGKGYDRWAATIAAGDWIGKETFYQAPLYPYALAVLYKIAGRDPMIVRWAQAFAGAGACVLLALAGRRWLTPNAGLIAGGLLAIYPPAIFFDGLVQKAAADNLLMCALLATLGAYVASERLAILGAAGVVLGLFALTRENALVFLAILACWLPLHLRERPWAERGKAVAVLIAGVAVLLLPVGLRNEYVGGDFLITTSQAGPNFYIGNHEGATGRYLPLHPDHETYEYERADAAAVAEQAAGHALTAGEVSSYWWGRSLAWITAHPVDWIELLARKFLITWNRAELPDSESLELYADRSPILALLSLVLGFGVLVALACPGIALSLSLRPRPALLYAMLLGFSAAVALFYVFGRYRFPLVPILALFAGYAIERGVAFARAKKKPALDPIVAGASVFGLLVAVLPPVVPSIGSRRLGYVNVAIGFHEAGQHQAAADAYRSAIALAPRISAPHHDLALELQALGRIDEAKAELQTAIQLDPRYAAAHEDLGVLLLRTGDFANGESHLREALHLDPARSSALANLGGAALARKQPGEAIEWYRKAIALSPGQARYHYQLSIALTDAGRTDEAKAELDATLRLDSGFAGAHDDLGILLARAGDLAGAATQFQEAYRLDPRRLSTLINLGGLAMTQGRPTDAAEWYRKALAINPDLPHVRENLAAAMAMNGRQGPR